MATDDYPATMAGRFAHAADRLFKKHYPMYAYEVAAFQARFNLDDVRMLEFLCVTLEDYPRLLVALTPKGDGPFMEDHPRVLGTCLATGANSLALLAVLNCVRCNMEIPAEVVIYAGLSTATPSSSQYS